MQKFFVLIGGAGLFLAGIFWTMPETRVIGVVIMIFAWLLLFININV